VRRRLVAPRGGGGRFVSATLRLWRGAKSVWPFNANYPDANTPPSRSGTHAPSLRGGKEDMRAAIGAFLKDSQRHDRAVLLSMASPFRSAAT
jgi:hypothetical protein